MLSAEPPMSAEKSKQTIDTNKKFRLEIRLWKIAYWKKGTENNHVLVRGDERALCRFDPVRCVSVIDPVHHVRSVRFRGGVQQLSSGGDRDEESTLS